MGGEAREMNQKDASDIQEWLDDERPIKAELIRTSESAEFELRLSKVGVGGELEYVIIGIPQDRKKDAN